MLEIAGIEPSVYEDLLNITISILQQTVTPDLAGETLTPDLLLETFQTVEGILPSTRKCLFLLILVMPIVSNSVVLYFRLLTSAQIRVDPESYAPFLLDFQMEPVEFCETAVERMGVDAGLSHHVMSTELFLTRNLFFSLLADDVQIAALARALGITIQVARLQYQQIGDIGFDFEPFGNARGLGANKSDPVVILRR